MAHFTPDNFVDGPAGGTPITSVKLLNLENEDAYLDALVDGVAGFGAVGDGVTDDTTALQNAFTAARAVNAVLQFGLGQTYIVSGALNPTGVDVRGNGATLRVKAGTTPTYGGVFAPTAAFSLQDMTIDLNKANTTDPGANTQGNGIYLNNATGWTGLAVVRNVQVINGYQCGMRFSTASSLTDAASAPLSRVMIDNPRVDSTKYGIFLTQTRGVTIINPWVTATAQDGIYDFLARDTQISGGRVSGTGNHGIVTQYSNGFSCTGVSVDAATNIGIVVGGGTVTNVEAKYFTITGNRVSNCTQVGISVDTTKAGSGTTPVASYSTVSGNVSRNNGIHGIYVHNGQYVSVTGNTCTGNASGGLSMDSNAVAVSGNTLVANAYGLKFLGNVSGYGSHQVGRNVVIGNTTSDYYFDPHGADNTPLDLQGAGTPETVVTAPIGSRFARVDGGAATSLYVKESGTGNTGWIGK